VTASCEGQRDAVDRAQGQRLLGNNPDDPVRGTSEAGGAAQVVFPVMTNNWSQHPGTLGTGSSRMRILGGLFIVIAWLAAIVLNPSACSAALSSA